MCASLTGWLLDVYPNDTNLTLWIIGEDGQRYRFFQDFSATVYAAGPFTHLRALWQWLAAQPIPVRLARTERVDVFHGPITVLAAEVLQSARLDELFRLMSAAFPDLTYFDADISLPLRHAAAFGVFPLARCHLEVEGQKVLHIAPLNPPWELDPEPAPLRILRLGLDRDPAHAEPQSVRVSYERFSYSLALSPKRALLVTLAAELRRYDPDVILTSWGDTWLMPCLQQASQETGLSLPLNRDETQPLVERKDRKSVV